MSIKHQKLSWLLLTLLLLIPAWVIAEGAKQSPSQVCKAKLQQINLGMTRHAIRQVAKLDDGLNGALKHERWVVCPCESRTKLRKLAKLNLSFRPVGISDEDYADPNKFQKWLQGNRPRVRAANWQFAHGMRDSDVLVKLSQPYCEGMIID